MNKFFASKKAKVTTGVVALFAVLAAGLAAIGIYYGSHALPGTTLAGEEVSGMTAGQVTTLLNDDLAGATVQIDGLAQSADITLAEAGVQVDVPATVAEVFEPNASFFGRYTQLFGSRNVLTVVDLQQSRFDEVYAQLSEDELVVEPVIGEVTYDGTQFVASPSVSGTQINKLAFQSKLVRNTEQLNFEPIELKLVEYIPDPSTEAVEDAAAEANQWMASPLNITDRGGNTLTPEPAERATWVEFDEHGRNVDVTLDPEVVKEWVAATAAETDVAPVDGVRNVNSAGTVVAVSVEAVSGESADNVDAIADGILEAFEAGEEYNGQLDYKTVEPTWTERLIADGAENLAYPAAPGERWISVNLSQFTATAYEGATPVMQSPIVPGSTNARTPTGQWSIYAKVPLQTMRGTNPDSGKYVTPDVPWILYYNGGYALHGAYWRSQFGYDAGLGGSNGCTNMPVSEAKRFYDWAHVGDPVVVHY